MSFISLLLEDLDIVEKPIVSCHSRENGNPDNLKLNMELNPVTSSGRGHVLQE